MRLENININQIFKQEFKPKDLVLDAQTYEINCLLDSLLPEKSIEDISSKNFKHPKNEFIHLGDDAKVSVSYSFVDNRKEDQAIVTKDGEDTVLANTAFKKIIAAKNASNKETKNRQIRAVAKQTLSIAISLSIKIW